MQAVFACRIKTTDTYTYPEPMPTLKASLGILLILFGLYTVGQNIIFTTQLSYYGWQRIPAIGAVIFLLSGIWIVLSAADRDKFLGWILLVIGIACIFMSSGIILRPVSLWSFLVAFTCLLGGAKLMSPRRLF
jgi:hypothetical protein